MDLFLDEAGYTGPDLVNLDQPVFVLASTVLTDAAAQELVAASFRNQDDGRELKHSRLSRTRKWRAEVLDFFRRVPKDQITFFGVHKEFVLLAYLIDFWLEPMAHEDGVNIYEQGGHIAWTNVTFITMTATLGDEARRELLRRFQVMTRDRTRFAYANFWESFQQAVNTHKLLDDAIGGLLAAEMRLGWEHLNQLPPDLLDLGDYGLLQTILHWRKKHPAERFSVIHDHSKMIQRNREKWDAILDPNNPSGVVGQDRRTIEFPLPVESLQLADSQSHLQLQIADIVAGAACTVMNARARNTHTEYADALVDTGIMDAAGGGIWPSTAISPEELETERPALRDAADFIGEIVAAHRRPRE